MSRPRPTSPRVGRRQRQRPRLTLQTSRACCSMPGGGLRRPRRCAIWPAASAIALLVGRAQPGGRLAVLEVRRLHPGVLDRLVEALERRRGRSATRRSRSVGRLLGQVAQHRQVARAARVGRLGLDHLGHLLAVRPQVAAVVVDAVPAAAAPARAAARPARAPASRRRLISDRPAARAKASSDRSTAVVQGRRRRVRRPGSRASWTGSTRSSDAAEDAAYVVGGAALGADPGHQQRTVDRRGPRRCRSMVAPTTAPKEPIGATSVVERARARRAPCPRRVRPASVRACWNGGASGLEVSASTKTPLPCSRAVAIIGSRLPKPRYGAAVIASAAIGRARVEVGVGVGLRGRADVAALHVEDDERTGLAGGLDDRSSTAMPREPNRSKNADCGLTAATRGASASAAVERELLQPVDRVGQAPGVQQAGVRVDARRTAARGRPSRRAAGRRRAGVGRSSGLLIAGAGAASRARR